MAKDKPQTFPVSLGKSDVHGWGVFATRDIKADEIIEVCPVILIKEKNESFTNYVFFWPEDPEKPSAVLALGLGSIYNHSPNKNATWDCDFENQTLIFKTIKDIAKDEEILVSYSEGWFKRRKIDISQNPKIINKQMFQNTMLIFAKFLAVLASILILKTVMTW